MLETEPTNRQSESNETSDNAAQGQSAQGQSAQPASEGGRRGLLRRARRSVSKPATAPSFSSGAQEGGSDAAAATQQGSGRGSAASRAAGTVPAVPGVPVSETDQPSGGGGSQRVPAAAFQPPVLVFQPPEMTSQPADSGPAGSARAEDDSGDEDGAGSRSRRRRRGGRGRGKGSSGDSGPGQAGDEVAEGTDGAAKSSGGKASDKQTQAAAEGGAKEAESARNGKDAASAPAAEENGEGGSSSRRRRRRRQRSGTVDGGGEVPADDPADTVVHVREPRAATESDDVRAVKGSTRLEAKRQRRREGRDTGRRRPPVITESEFLARREAVERVMAVRQQGDRTQIAVLEDGVLVEHYVDRATHQSYVGNVYLGKVQNVLPSMEAAFVDIGKGRNAVLYAGEVNFDASGLEGVAKRIESALKSGQSIMVQVTKDPIGHKGARLTSQISLPGRYLVYVPGASMTGISRKLPDTERNRLKQILKKVAPEEGGIIVRTAAEGASEEELQHDVTRLVAQWQAIERKAKTASAPDLLYGEPDLTIRVVRDIFNEDFTKLVIASDSEWDLVDEYVRYVAPNLAERLERWADDKDLFTAYRIDEQLTKALDRKVWLPSGGSLVIDTTEAMTVIDVNTGKFTGQGGNLEQTVTRNNLEAAEEIVRQLRLRDIGGIIVIDFIDMVLESNRDLVLRRLIECLARDRTKHQVAEVTSLGLVQMTRKRVGSGLLAAFSVPCEHCNGRGILVSTDLTELPHGHGRNGNQGGSPKPGPARSRSARSKAIAKVAAKTIESEATASGADDEKPDEKPDEKASSKAAKAGGAGRKDAAVAADGAGSAADGAASAADGAERTGVAAETRGAADGESAATKAESAPRRRPRRSAHREAGPPDSVRAAQDATAEDGEAAAGGPGEPEAATNANSSGAADSETGAVADESSAPAARSTSAQGNGEAAAGGAQNAAAAVELSVDGQRPAETSAAKGGAKPEAGGADGDAPASGDAGAAGREASPSATSE
jgi:ribonuclease E